MSSDPWGRDALVQQVRESFEFLESRLIQPVLLDEDPFRTVVAYVLDPLTIELELDWRDLIVTLLLCRTVDRGRPPGYYFHEGRPMRVHLALALDGGNQDDRSIAARLRKAVGKSGPEAMENQVREFSAAIRSIVERLPEFRDCLFPEERDDR
jgi:hypothetical protein